MKILTTIIALLFAANISAQKKEVYSYYNNNQKKELNIYVDGKLDGKCVTWDSLGNVTGIAHYKEGLKDGQWKIWYDNGKPAYDFHYKQGQKVGVWKAYDRQGNIIDKKSMETKPMIIKNI